MNAKTYTAIIFLATSLSALGSVPANANSHLNCNAYAQSVVNQAKKNIGLGCGYSGPVWSTDFNFHFSWCNQNSTQIHHLGEQENIRAAQMQQCIVKANKKDEKHRFKEKYCLKYAKKAKNLRDQVNTACKGQDGGEWPQSIKQDVDFCLQKGGSFADLTNNNRVKKIKVCKTASSTKTYKPANFRGTPLDGCFEKGAGCGKGVADIFCHNKKHVKSQSHKTNGTKFTVYLYCLDMNAARKQRYMDAGGKCHCSDDSNRCSYFTKIVCQGKR